MKRFNLIFLIVIMSMAFSVPTFAGQWCGDNDTGWKYQNDDGNFIVNDWLVLGDDATYYFDNNGIMQVGLSEIGGQKYYFYEDGRLTYNWNTPDGYKVDNSGRVIEDFSTGITFLLMAGYEEPQLSNMVVCRIENESDNNFIVNPSLIINTDGVSREFLMTDISTMDLLDYGTVNRNKLQYFAFVNHDLSEFAINRNTVFSFKFEYNNKVYEQDIYNFHLYRFHLE